MVALYIIDILKYIYIYSYIHMGILLVDGKVSC